MKRAAALLLATALFAAGCTDDVDPAAPKANGAGGGTLEYDAVAALTLQRLTKDPDCPIGKWADNSTGVDEKYRADVTQFKQFDCYLTESQLLPNRGQQSIYVRFTSAETAKAYATDQAKLYPVLLVGSTAVVAGSGLEQVDMKQYLSAVRDLAGGTGEVLGK
ncbi:hypothetical protein Val02_20850 [Virgisporangium aliadipatigenens]|uniref:Lipoprotein n=1 Tax=Virgisporangium aliadipatigenens TaxID=741659 RepID=A0A8J3YH94_9ACTN|nr:hypothetical protein [Virgisporangium aliadipatigenens]GIJ45199.1 hypothetical protein Val02_20850 [Virgisporangium aliadipatigenens]